MGANLSGANMTNAVIDRVLFDGANLTGVKFINAVITGTTFVVRARGPLVLCACAEEPPWSRGDG